MSVNLSVSQAKKLHQAGQAETLHGLWDSGFLKAAVYGANDGIVTTFAVVAGVAGAGLSPSIVLILGVANMVADAISMGLGDFLGERSERKYRQHQYQIERWEIDNIPEEEEKEMVSYFENMGIKSADAKSLSSTICKYPEVATNFGFIDEMKVVPNFEDGLWKTGLITFLAFVAAGSLPLAPYFYEFFGGQISLSQQFNFSIIATILALFFVGSLRTFITKGAWWKNGLEMLFIGSLAAISAYFLGAGVEQLIR